MNVALFSGLGVRTFEELSASVSRLREEVAGRLSQGPEAALQWLEQSVGLKEGAARQLADYLRIAHDYHTVLIDHVPAMDYADRNAAKRFIALIDTFYDNAVKLMASAAAEPAQLYRAQEGFEAMEFNRTVSRLTEMGSDSYLALPHGRSDSAASGSTTGLVET